jgi:hypothetical protein
MPIGAYLGNRATMLLADAVHERARRFLSELGSKYLPLAQLTLRDKCQRLSFFDPMGRRRRGACHFGRHSEKMFQPCALGISHDEQKINPRAIILQ